MNLPNTQSKTLNYVNKLLPPLNPNFSLDREVNLFNNKGFITKERLMNNIFSDDEDKHGLKDSKLIIGDLTSNIQKEMGFNAKDFMVNHEYFLLLFIIYEIKSF